MKAVLLLVLGALASAEDRKGGGLSAPPSYGEGSSVALGDRTPLPGKENQGGLPPFLHAGWLDATVPSAWVGAGLLRWALASLPLSLSLGEGAPLPLLTPPPHPEAPQALLGARWGRKGEVASLALGSPWGWSRGGVGGAALAQPNQGGGG